MGDFFVSLLGKWSYLGLFLVLLAAGLGLPLPEDIPLVAAGYLVHLGKADLHLMIATGMFGVLLGDSILFLMGRRYGEQIVQHRWLRRIAKPWLVEKARQKYVRHGAKILFAARFMPGLRSVLFLTAGTFRIPFWKFFVIDGFAALISVPTWVWLSSRFSGTIEELLGEARTASYVIGATLAAVFLVWMVYEYFRYLRRRNGVAVDAQARSAPLVTPPPSASPAGPTADTLPGRPARRVAPAAGRT